MTRPPARLILRLTRGALAATVLCLVTGVTGAAAEIESRVVGNISVGAEALDVATTADGRRTYVLLTGGTVSIYDAAGKNLGSLQVPPEAGAIATSPDGGRLLVTAGSALQIVAVNLIHQLDLSGSPFRGQADAPVTVAVFNDFQ